MATYTEIAAFVKRKFGYTVKPCWIADVKASYGLNRGPYGGARAADRKIKCPPDKRYDIEAAMISLRVIESRK